MSLADKLSNTKVEFIRRHYGKQPVKKIADKLDIVPGTVRKYALLMGLCQKSTYIDPLPPKQIVPPDYRTGDTIKIQVKELNRDRITRRKATVSEVYPRFVLLQIPSQYGGVSTRVCMDYFDLQDGAVVEV